MGGRQMLFDGLQHTVAKHNLEIEVLIKPQYRKEA
jgi:hypothetical protein